MGGGVVRMDNFSDIYNGNVVRKYDSKDSGGGGGGGEVGGWGGDCMRGDDPENACTCCCPLWKANMECIRAFRMFTNAIVEPFSGTT